LIDKLQNVVYRLTTELQIPTQESEPILRRNGQSFPMQSFKCISCDGPEVSNQMGCVTCGPATKRLEFCNRDFRVLEYFRILRVQDLGPTVTRFPHVSAVDFISRLKEASTKSVHACSAESNCPLKLKLANVIRKCEDLLNNTDWLCDDEWSSWKPAWLSEVREPRTT
jgi:hypothetical protein